MELLVLLLFTVPIILIILLSLPNLEVQTKRTKDKIAVQETAPNASTHNIRFKNLVLYSGHNTRYTEIDEVIVSPYGIFCIEHKAYVGILFGSKNRPQWTQCRYDGKKPIPNPFHQNYKHIKALELLLGKNLVEPIDSLVVFSRAKSIHVDSPKAIPANELTDYLKNKQKIVYTPTQYAKICRVLAYASTISPGRMNAHIEGLARYLMTKQSISD